jgi:hypothetical protein
MDNAALLLRNRIGRSYRRGPHSSSPIVSPSSQTGHLSDYRVNRDLAAELAYNFDQMEETFKVAALKLASNIFKLFATTCLFVFPTQAVEPQQSSTKSESQYSIERIEIVGNRRVQSEELWATIISRPGDAYSDDAVRRDVQALRDTGFFEDVRLEVENSPDQPNGKTVVFILREKAIINRVDSRTLPDTKAPLLSPSSCSKAHGWMRISTEKFVGNLLCFSPEINGQYTSIGGGGVNGRADVSIQMNLLSKSGTHSCKTPMVIIELREGTEKWDAYHVRNGQFGDCTITQHYENGYGLWKGHAEATLVVVKGDTETGSPRHLHSEKDSSGNPLAKTIQIDWEFDRYPVKSR